MERAVRFNRLESVRQPIDRVPGPWLACYPIFQNALRGGETTFQALPDYAKRVLLLRTSVDAAEQAIDSKTLDDLSVSFVELCTRTVSEAVEHYLGSEHNEAAVSLAGSDTLSQIPAQRFAPVSYPLIARPPCLLRPGRHVFTDGWMRFFAYRGRGDLTIPLLAIDWLDFHDRLRMSRDFWANRALMKTTLRTTPSHADRRLLPQAKMSVQPTIPGTAEYIRDRRPRDLQR